MNTLKSVFFIAILLGLSVACSGQQTLPTPEQSATSPQPAAALPSPGPPRSTLSRPTPPRPANIRTPKTPPTRPLPATPTPVAAPTRPPTATPAAPGPTLAAPEQAKTLLTVDPAPSGETLRPLLGVNLGPVPGGTDPHNADVTAQYQEIGVTMIRTHGYSGPFDMSIMYPDQNADPTDPGSYQFGRSDRVFRAILDGGFEPYLRLGDSWNTPGLEQRAPANPQNWVRAAVEVVRHYRQMAAEAGIPLRYVEIWNEPNSKHFWDSTPRAFFDLFAQTALALKAEFPDLKVGGPALTQGAVMLPPGRQYTDNFLTYLQDHDVPLDFLSWHIYSNDPEDYREVARFFREQLDAHGYADAESHITEWNTAADTGSGVVSDVSLRAGGKGASLLSAFWIVLQEEGVDVSTIFRGTDTSIEVPGFYGIFYADGRPKHPALAFSLWARMAAHPQRLNVSHGNDGLWVLAGQDERGEIALLVVNPTETPTSWQATYAGRDLGPGAILYQVSDAADTVQTFSLASPVVEISAYTVQLLVAPAPTSSLPTTPTSAVPAPTSAVPTPMPGRYGVFTMRLDGTELRQIYSTDQRLSGLRPSPDGSRFLCTFFYRDVNGDGQYGVADMSALEIGLLSSDSATLRRLTNNDFIDAAPVWSPDGAAILFASNRDGGGKLDLFVMDLEGNLLRQLTSTPDIHEGDPDWVGETIVYTRNAADDRTQSVWAMSADGTAAHQVTFPSAPGPSDSFFKPGDFDPRLSPDGKRIAFERHLDDDFALGKHRVGRWDIFVIHADGSGEQDLTGEREAAGFPKWSPDGQTLLFLAHRMENGRPVIGLYTIGADGEGRRRVPIPIPNLVPLGGEWLPDGEHIVFVAEVFR